MSIVSKNKNNVQIYSIYNSTITTKMYNALYIFVATIIIFSRKIVGLTTTIIIFSRKIVGLPKTLGAIMALFVPVLEVYNMSVS